MSLTTSATLLGLAALLVTAVAAVVPPSSPQTTSPAGLRDRTPAGQRSVPAAGETPLSAPASPGPPEVLAASGTPVPLVAAPAPGPGFHWPLAGRPVVGRRFSVGPQPWSPGHRGADLVAGPGAQVLAPGPGTVRFSGTVVSRGVLTLDHGDGLLTSYEPVRVATVAGTRVRTGQRIGWVAAATGHCPVECLHWGARREGRYVDPLTLLAAWRGPPILLPTG